MIPNLIWSILFIGPVFYYCYHYVSPHLLYIFLAISFIVYFLPRSFFDLIQVSRGTGFYHAVGIRTVNQFAQNGYLVNRWIKRKYPQYRAVSFEKKSAHKYYHQTYFLEKFHWSFFLFFFIVNVLALASGSLIWAVILFVCNLLYNVYPILLQQWVRVKLSRFRNK